MLRDIQYESFIITGYQLLRPDMVMADASRNLLFMVEITVGFETFFVFSNLLFANQIITKFYVINLTKTLINTNNVKFINLSIGATFVQTNSRHCIYDLLANE